MQTGPVSQALAIGRRAVAHLGCAAVQFLYPTSCPLCGSGIDETTLSGIAPALCAECSVNVAPVIPHACRRCAAPVGPFLDTVNGCIHCRKDRFAFEGVVRLGGYDGSLRSLCLKGKQPGAEPLLTAAAGLLWQREAAALDGANVDIVIPVPLHWTQRVVRPHNPATVVGRVLARRLRASFNPHILRKVRRTPAQTSLLPSARRTNLRNAFRTRGGWLVRGRTVLLVDDVLTTGTTAHECARTLHQAGAARVTVAVLARGLGAKQDAT